MNIKEAKIPRGHLGSWLPQYSLKEHAVVSGEGRSRGKVGRRMGWKEIF